MVYLTDRIINAEAPKIKDIRKYLAVTYYSIVAILGLNLVWQGVHLYREVSELKREVKDLKQNVIRQANGLIYIIENLPDSPEGLNSEKRVEMLGHLEEILGSDLMNETRQNSILRSAPFQIELEITAPIK